MLHKATTALAQRHQVIVVEDLNVAGMSRRKPGAGRGGRGLNPARLRVRRAGGAEASTPHDGHPAAGQTGTASPQGEAA